MAAHRHDAVAAASISEATSISASFPAVKRWFDEMAARPGVQRGVAVLAEGRDQSAITDAEREVYFGKTQFAAR